MTSFVDGPLSIHEANLFYFIEILFCDDNPICLTVWLKPTGNAPIIKNKKWVVERNCTMAKIMGFLRQLMQLDGSASVFLYVNQSFAPSPDSEVGNVYECFNINGKLVLYYSTSPAWG
ncbi:Ubiquitin-like protein ATG12 [Araneus ventricosus]|uniref:Ubiquitin-like protein ATG12 n=1 Tax=Araneus ventricosus TaxID=182803 RepID=A0A4Y2HEJ1_ARAVE|nr:Ubiquitin-like protein ATG12 [Araneus ventricosus]